MRALTRRGRLAITLAVVAAGIVAYLTYGWTSPGLVFAIALVAEVTAVGAAYVVDDAPWRRARRRERVGW